MAAMNNMEEEVRRNIWLKGFHDGFFGVGVIVISAEEPNEKTTEPTPTEEQAPTPAEDKTPTPAEDQTPEIPKDAIGVCCAEREMPSQQQPYQEKFNNPPQGTYSFVNADKIKELMDDSIEELQNATHADQVRGKVRDICDLALAMGADELVDLCEDFTVGDATRSQVVAAAQAALGEYYTEHRKITLRNGFEAFCKEYLTSFEELAAIIND